MPPRWARGPGATITSRATTATRKRSSRRPGRCARSATRRSRRSRSTAPLRPYPLEDAWQAEPPRFSHTLHLDAAAWRARSASTSRASTATCRDGKLARPDHATCARCHAPEAGVAGAPPMADCAGCHADGIHAARARARLIRGDLHFDHDRHRTDRRGTRDRVRASATPQSARARPATPITRAPRDRELRRLPRRQRSHAARRCAMRVVRDLPRRAASQRADHDRAAQPPAGDRAAARSHARVPPRSRRGRRARRRALRRVPHADVGQRARRVRRVPPDDAPAPITASRGASSITAPRPPPIAIAARAATSSSSARRATRSGRARTASPARSPTDHGAARAHERARVPDVPRASSYCAGCHQAPRGEATPMKLALAARARASAVDRARGSASCVSTTSRRRATCSMRPTRRAAAVAPRARAARPTIAAADGAARRSCRRRRRCATSREPVSVRVNLGYVVDGTSLTGKPTLGGRSRRREPRLRDDPRVRLRRGLLQHARRRRCRACRRTSPARFQIAPADAASIRRTPRRRGRRHRRRRRSRRGSIAAASSRAPRGPRSRTSCPTAARAAARARRRALRLRAVGACTCTARSRLGRQARHAPASTAAAACPTTRCRDHRRRTARASAARRCASICASSRRPIPFAIARRDARRSPRLAGRAAPSQHAQLELDWRPSRDIALIGQARTLDGELANEHVQLRSRYKQVTNLVFDVTHRHAADWRWDPSVVGTDRRRSDSRRGATSTSARCCRSCSCRCAPAR